MKYRIKRIVAPLCLGATIIGLTGCMTPEDRQGRSAGQYIDDKKIAAEVRDELRRDPLYKYHQVHVTAFHGTVQLSGFAMNDAHRERASELASRVPGTLAIENNISIVPDHPYPRDLRARDAHLSPTNDHRVPVRDRTAPDRVDPDPPDR